MARRKGFFASIVESFVREATRPSAPSSTSRSRRVSADRTERRDGAAVARGRHVTDVPGRLFARRAFLLMLVVGSLVIGCSRGPVPPSPAVVVHPVVVGVVDWTEDGDPISFPIPLDGGIEFGRSDGTAPTRLINWPDTEPDEANLIDGHLLLGGDDSTIGEWFQLSGPGPNADGCWMVWGGAFDEGNAVRFASGVEVPKSDDFEIRTYGHDVDPFPARGSDGICVDREGLARYFSLSVGS